MSGAARPVRIDRMPRSPEGTRGGVRRLELESGEGADLRESGESCQDGIRVHRRIGAHQLLVTELGPPIQPRLRNLSGTFAGRAGFFERPKTDVHRFAQIDAVFLAVD